MGLGLSAVARGDEPRAGTIRFTRKAPVVGESAEHRSRMEMSLDFRVVIPDSEPTPVVMTSQNLDSMLLTVLATKGGVETRMRITYGDVVEMGSVGGGKQTREVSPVSQKAYEAEVKKGTIRVTQAQGKPVSSEEKAQVLKDLVGLGEEDAFVAAFPSTPLQVGDSLEAVAKVFEEQLQDSATDEVTYQDTRIHLAEIRQDPRGPMGVLAVSTLLLAPIGEEDAPLSIEMRVLGTLNILADGTVLTDVSMGGPVKLVMTDAAREAGVEIHGKGSMRMNLTVRPVPAAPGKN
ncbi:hypothetical protein [Myxococcus stipitatus]|uniref:hypothetical protein n=1 Tax=Myxococcus stipitatus TaxID=83455 RepID=UPI0030D551B9